MKPSGSSSSAARLSRALLAPIVWISLFAVGSSFHTEEARQIATLHNKTGDVFFSRRRVRDDDGRERIEKCRIKCVRFQGSFTHKSDAEIQTLTVVICCYLFAERSRNTIVSADSPNDNGNKRKHTHSKIDPAYIPLQIHSSIFPSFCPQTAEHIYVYSPCVKNDMDVE